MRFRAAVPLAIAALAAGCAAPRWHERQVLLLEGPSLADYDVHYAGDDCVVPQRWPRRYRVDRGVYTLSVIVPIRYADEPPALELELRGEGRPQLRALEAALPEDPLASGLRRYRYEDRAGAGGLTLEVLRDGRLIGRETLRWQRDRCRALLWRDG